MAHSNGSTCSFNPCTKGCISIPPGAGRRRANVIGGKGTGPRIRGLLGVVKAPTDLVGSISRRTRGHVEVLLRSPMHRGERHRDDGRNQWHQRRAREGAAGPQHSECEEVRSEAEQTWKDHELWF